MLLKREQQNGAVLKEHNKKGAGKFKSDKYRSLNEQDEQDSNSWCSLTNTLTMRSNFDL